MPDKGNFAAVIIDRAAFNQGANAKYDLRIEASDEMSTIVSRGPHAVAFAQADDVTCLRATGGTLRSGSENIVVDAIPIDHRNAMRDPDKHDEMNRQGVGVGKPGDPAHTVTTAFVHAVAFAQNQVMEPHAFYSTGGSHGLEPHAGVSPPLKVGSALGISSPPAVAYRKPRRAQSVDDHETWVEDGQANTLNQFDVGDVRTTQIVCQKCGHLHDEGRICTECGNDLACDTLDLCSDFLLEDAGKRSQTISFHPTQDPISQVDGPTHALGCGSSQGCATVAVATHMVVRRLTPVECERLQGFPDGWTDIGTPEKPTDDTHRYKQLGNAVTVNVAEWIARRTAEARA